MSEEQCKHHTLHKILGGPQYACTNCPALFEVRLAKSRKRDRRQKQMTA